MRYHSTETAEVLIWVFLFSLAMRRRNVVDRRAYTAFNRFCFDNVLSLSRRLD